MFDKFFFFCLLIAEISLCVRVIEAQVARGARKASKAIWATLEVLDNL